MDAIRWLTAAAGNAALYVTLNAASYSREQHDFLQDVVASFADAQVDGVILGNLLMVADVRAHGLEAVASTMVGVYNADEQRLSLFRFELFCAA